jgi:hypothetical protein
MSEKAPYQPGDRARAMSEARRAGDRRATDPSPAAERKTIDKEIGREAPGTKAVVKRGAAAIGRAAAAPARAVGGGGEKIVLTHDHITGATQKGIVAVAAGLIALQVFSYLFGQYFNFDLRTFGQQFQKAGGAKPAYLPLYQGQTARLVALRTEGIQGGAGVQGVQTV